MADRAELPVVAYLRATQDGKPLWSEDCVCEDPVYPSDPDGSDEDCISLALTSHAAAQARITALQAELEALQISLSGWLCANAPGGWIDELRKRAAASMHKD